MEKEPTLGAAPSVDRPAEAVAVVLRYGRLLGDRSGWRSGVRECGGWVTARCRETAVVLVGEGEECASGGRGRCLVPGERGSPAQAWPGDVEDGEVGFANR